MAAATLALLLDEPSDRLITVAPWSAAQSTPRVMSEVQPEPSSSSTFTGRMRASGARPATPVALLATAATIPDTWVPWPLSSLLPSPVDVSLWVVNSAPGSTRPARSGWLTSAPVSTTPTIWPVPVDDAQASSACTVVSAHCEVR